MTPRDLFRFEQLGEVAISPDGRLIAYVIKRPQETACSFAVAWLESDDRADVWLSTTSSDKPENITQGARDCSGFFAPRWSPDGNSLAMLSTRGGNVRIWIWSKMSRQLHMLSERAVEPWLQTVEWISSNEIAFAALKEGEKPRAMTPVTGIANVAPREWSNAWRGQIATASVLESGIDPLMKERPQSDLIVKDIRSGEERFLARAPGFATVRASPDRGYIAFLEQIGVWHPVAGAKVRPWLQEQRYRLQIVSLANPKTMRRTTGIRDVNIGSVRWSADGTELAAVGYEDKDSQADRRVFRCATISGICKTILLDLKGAGQFWDSANYFTGSIPFYEWFSSHHLLVFGHSEDSKDPSQWQVVDQEGRPELSAAAATRDLSGTPIPDGDRDSFLGIVDGNIFRFNSRGFRDDNVAEGFKGKVVNIAWPDNSAWNYNFVSLATKPSDEIVFTVRAGSGTELYILNLRTKDSRQILKPAPDANLIARDGQTGASIFFVADRTGTYLWTTKDGKASQAILTTNIFLREITESQLRKIQYRSLDGQNLTGWAVLPVGYQDGRRYPVVVWVYLGQMFGDNADNLASFHINGAAEFNLQLLAAHGYVALAPSMPPSSSGDPYMDLPKGVLPAIDKLIEIGVADPQRIGVMGFSFGGYSTYGLITQTDRFKAALAVDGPCDFLSSYGTFDPQRRYEPFVHENPLRMWNPEDSLSDLSPWQDLSRYLRNSPIAYAGRVQTPIMIVHGDLDPIPIEQAEEFFTAMYRQNKRATFVRYWGEGHTRVSPANVVDLWTRIYAWFDEFLVAPQPAEHGALPGR